MLYMLTFTINIPQMFAYIPYMDPMGNERSGLIPPSLLKILITFLVRKPINQLIKSRLTSVDASLQLCSVCQGLLKVKLRL